VVSLLGLMASPALADIANPGGGGCAVGGVGSSLAGLGVFVTGATILAFGRRISRKAK